MVREGRKKAATRFKRPSTQNLNSATVTKTYQSIPFSLIITIPRHALAMVTRPSQPHTEREKRSTKPIVGAAHHHRTLRTSLLAKRPHPTQASSPQTNSAQPKKGLHKCAALSTNATKDTAQLQPAKSSPGGLLTTTRWPYARAGSEAYAGDCPVVQLACSPRGRRRAFLYLHYAAFCSLQICCKAAVEETNDTNKATSFSNTRSTAPFARPYLHKSFVWAWSTDMSFPSDEQRRWACVCERERVGEFVETRLSFTEACDKGTGMNGGGREDAVAIYNNKKTKYCTRLQTLSSGGQQKWLPIYHRCHQNHQLQH